MITLRYLTNDPRAGGHGADVFGVAYTADSSTVVSAGWDGWLRFWNTEKGAHVGQLLVGEKPLSACAVSPDDTCWLTGSMDGMLARWDAESGTRASIFLAHTRPISAIVHSPDREWLATASWDRHIHLWRTTKETECRSFTGHSDIVAGCCFTPDGRTLISWSHDKTVQLWDVASGRSRAELKGHLDRINAGAVCPLGGWFVSGSREKLVTLWDVDTGKKIQAARVGGEVRACFFLLDGESLVVVDGNGQLTVHRVPSLEVESVLDTGLTVQCGTLAPSGAQLALGCGDGMAHLVAIDGFDSVPLAVRATQEKRTTSSGIGRLFGRRKTASICVCTCPACRRTFELPGGATGAAALCPGCQRHLRVCAVAPLGERGV